MHDLRPSFRSTLAALAVAAFFPALAGAAGGVSPAAAVSPGELDREVETASSCPTYSWGEVQGAAGYELAVFERDESGELVLALRREVAGGATSWSPSRADCLAPGAAFVWAVRAKGAAAPGAVAGDWSAPRRFRTPDRPGDEEVAAALDVLRRWREGATGRDVPEPRVAPGLAGVAAPPRPGASAGGGPVAAIRGTFDGQEGVGVSGVATSTSGPATGVRGETASSKLAPWTPTPLGAFDSPFTPMAYGLVAWCEEP